MLPKKPPTTAIGIVMSQMTVLMPGDIAPFETLFIKNELASRTQRYIPPAIEPAKRGLPRHNFEVANPQIKNDKSREEMDIAKVNLVGSFVEYAITQPKKMKIKAAETEIANALNALFSKRIKGEVFSAILALRL